MTRPTRLPRPLLAITILIAASVFSWSPAIAKASPGAGPNTTSPPSSIPPPAAASTPGGAMSVVSQTSWEGAAPNNVFRISLHLGKQASAANLQVTMFGQLRSRTNFDQSLAGQYRGQSVYSQTAPMSWLQPSGGRVNLQIPLGPGATAMGPGALPMAPQVSPSSNGVYPVQIQATNGSGGAIGAPVITYVVWVPNAAGVNKLNAAVTLPIGVKPAVSPSGDVNPLPGGSSGALSSEAATISSHPTLPLTLGVNPETLDGLASGSKDDKATVNSVTDLVHNGAYQVLPQMYGDANPATLASAGLASETQRQYGAGAASTAADLGGFRAPPDTLAFSGQLNTAAVGDLQGLGARRLVVPENTLSNLPESLQQNTLGRPTHLQGSQMTVFGADTLLADHFSGSGDQVLQANQLLAEMAMIETEQPSLNRGVVVMPPEGWTPNSDFLSVLLSGLSDNPLVAPQTVGNLFDNLNTASVSRTFANPPPPTFNAATIGTIRRQVGTATAVASELPNDPAARNDAQLRLLVAESSDFNAEQRSAALKASGAALDGDLRSVSLPTGSSFTLTSNAGTVPVAVTTKVTGAQVELVMNSRKLKFRPFVPPAGDKCNMLNETSVVCQLTLTQSSVLLRVPVQARAPGVFGLNLTLRTPDGNTQIGTVDYTVRNSAVSTAALILTIGAALLLVIWWIRDRRRTRRARVAAGSSGAEDRSNEDLVTEDRPKKGDQDSTNDERDVTAVMSALPAKPKSSRGGNR